MSYGFHSAGLVRVTFLIFMGLAFPVSDGIALSLAVSPEQLTQKSNLVILGTVKEKITEERQLRMGMFLGKTEVYSDEVIIITDYEVALEKTFKTVIDGDRLSMLTLGGYLPDGRSWTHSKYFELEVGDRFVAFLYYDNRNKRWGVYAGSQGVFKVVEDPTSLNNPIAVSAYKGHLVYQSNSPLPSSNKLDVLKLKDLLNIIDQEARQ